MSLNTLPFMDQPYGPRPASSDDVPPVSARPVPPPTVEAASLFNGRDEVRLLHRGQEYRLRVTRQGKLILTK